MDIKARNLLLLLFRQLLRALPDRHHRLVGPESRQDQYHPEDLSKNIFESLKTKIYYESSPSTPGPPGGPTLPGAPFNPSQSQTVWLHDCK